MRQDTRQMQKIKNKNLWFLHFSAANKIIQISHDESQKTCFSWNQNQRWNLATPLACSSHTTPWRHATHCCQTHHGKCFCFCIKQATCLWISTRQTWACSMVKCLLVRDSRHSCCCIASFPQHNTIHYGMAYIHIRVAALQAFSSY